MNMVKASKTLNIVKKHSSTTRPKLLKTKNIKYRPTDKSFSEKKEIVTKLDSVNCKKIAIVEKAIGISKVRNITNSPTGPPKVHSVKGNRNRGNKRKKKNNTKNKESNTVKRLNSNRVSVAVSALLKVVQKNADSKAALLDIPEPIFMQVECIKIPICATKQLRFKLQHPLINESSDILLITADKKGSKIFPEKAIEHFKELLSKHNISFIQKVIPLRMLQQEYSQYEMRRKLVDQYDLILADATIIKSLPARLGHCILYNRKMPIAVHLNRQNLKQHFQTAMSKTQMAVKSNGHVSTVQVGHTKMAEGEISDNILEVSQGLAEVFPGGWKNIRSLNIKTPKSISLPVYLSLLSPNMVKIPVELPKKRTEVEGELSTIPGVNVVVRPDGTVYLKKVKDEVPMDDSLDEEILKEAEKYIQSSKTIRYDNSDDENSDKEADAVTAAVENEFLNKYKKFVKSKDIDTKAEEQEEEEGEYSGEEDDVVLPLGNKRKRKNDSKLSFGKSPKKKQKKGNQQDQLKDISQNTKGGVPVNKRNSQFRGVRGGKKNKLNKNQRKAMIKQKKAGKK